MPKNEKYGRKKKRVERAGDSNHGKMPRFHTEISHLRKISTSSESWGKVSFLIDHFKD
ncbi:MAG: hypothetical protein ACTSYI_07600 [Promethearchaeota archaeon]